MSQREFAKRMGMTEKHISHLINGKVELSQDVALRLESVLGVPAKFWNNLEAIYREKVARATAENERLRAELEQVQRDFDGLCEYIDSEGFLRKQFCESGNLDLESRICPSLQEHPGYIDSDDCEGCDHFCNSWRSQKEDEHEAADR